MSLYTGTKGQVIRVVSADTGAVSNGAKRQRILAVSEWSPEEKVRVLESPTYSYFR